MGVRVREQPKGSGVYYIFINHAGRRKAKRVGTNKKTADQVAEKIRAKLLLGDLDIEKVSCPTFKKVAGLWLALPHDWKESTRETHVDNLNNHIYPAVGKIPINRIGRRDIKLFFDRKAAAGLSLGTLKVIRAPFSGVLSYAVDLELITVNPLLNFTMKYKSNRREIDPLNEIEAQRLLDESTRFMGGKYYPVFLTALRTGMRIGEIQALKWSDIDFKRRQIEVQRSYRKRRMTDTKSHKRRRVDMTPQLVDTLMKHRTAEKKKALKNGRAVSTFVFTGDRDEMLNRISFQNALNRCLERLKLRRISTHSLRHSYATIRLMRGHNVGDVSYQLGHSSIKITYDVYVHWIPSKFKSQVDELDTPEGMQIDETACR